jgi:hypothetical protein
MAFPELRLNRYRNETLNRFPEWYARSTIPTRYKGYQKVTTKATAETSHSKDIVNKNGEITKLTEWATAEANSIEDLERIFGEAGVSYSAGEEVTGDYQVISGDEKPLWAERVIGKRLFAVRWEFHPGDFGPDSEFVTIYLLVEGAGKFIVNDGSKSGMYAQLRKITDTRIDNGQPEDRAHAGLKVERGLKKSKPFFFNEQTKKAWKDGEDEKLKRPVRPTFGFVF